MAIRIGTRPGRSEALPAMRAILAGGTVEPFVDVFETFARVVTGG